jgi:hypothetical protein
MPLKLPHGPDGPDGPDGAALARRRPTSGRYLQVLTWAFTIFSFLRVVSYLPALLAIWQQGDSSQHSVLTWLIWTGSNLTMSAWLYEQNGQRMNGAAWVCLANTSMCACTLALVLAYRF